MELSKYEVENPGENAEESKSWKLYQKLFTELSEYDEDNPDETAEWFRRFRDDPNQLDIAIAIWREPTLGNFDTQPDDPLPWPYPDYLPGITNLIALWCDLEAPGIDPTPLQIQ